MRTNELRAKFLDYFKEQGHTEVSSSPLVPGNDPTLLFTNAGMVQFKDVFLGNEVRSYSRACSSQRCVRAGGKHNDLDNVGYTARHHTFFEMLGNFSFGDYFKREAIQFAWTFLTKHLQLPAEKLWVTVFEDDDEAADIWLKELKVDSQRFSRCGEKDNFWSMGEVGPCGPCTEIFYDHGPEIAGGPPGSADEDGDRYIEIWNLVFMQYNRDKAGNLTALPKPSVDTGMGLERIAAVMQGVHSNYDIDLFQYLIKAIANIVHCDDLQHQSLRVIADHIRSCSFLISDGVMPSNEGRGYVLRRIIRRAIRHGHHLGMREPFFYRVVAPLVEVMGQAYPQLVSGQAQIEKILHNEQIQFDKTLQQGLIILANDISQLKTKEIPGETVFKLYDTYGFPVDLTADIAREQGFTIDMAGFESAMTQQRQRSQTASQFVMSEQGELTLSAKSDFSGYRQMVDEGQVIALYHGEQAVDRLTEDQQGMIVLDNTPFYAESGGQVGDTGILECASGQFQVLDTTKINQAICHHGKVITGEISLQEQMKANVDNERRQAIRLNHSATHLMHAALRQLLGTHVQQKGSIVTAQKLRFDFSHYEALTPAQLTAIENLVNEQIRANLPVDTELMSIEEAKNSGAIALFGEKYSEQVRVLSMGAFSKELCGGTHVERTGDIGIFKIIMETSIAAGIRRLEAVTGSAAVALMQAQSQQLQHLSELLKSSPEQLTQKVSQQLKQNRELEKTIEQLQTKLSRGQSNDLMGQAYKIADIDVLAVELKGVNKKTLRDTLDQLKSKMSNAVIVLASVEGSKINLIAGVSNKTHKQLHAGNIVNHVASQVGGRGGGRADMAQAGGTQPEHLLKALASVKTWLTEQLELC